MHRCASATFAALLQTTLLQTGLASAALAVSASPAAAAEFGAGIWAATDDPVAKQLIDQERRWGVDACEPSTVVAEFLAEDFIGTSPRGQLYPKATMLPAPGSHPGSSAPKITERNCKLLNAKVRFFGPDVAVIYGNESADSKGPHGKTVTRVLIWTDTALRRDGKWQVIAVQDMIAPAGWTPAKWNPGK